MRQSFCGYQQRYLGQKQTVFTGIFDRGKSTKKVFLNMISE